MLHSFAHVVEELPEAKLIICGHGSPEEKKFVSNLVTELKLTKSVILEKFRLDARLLICAADIVLVSSQGYESFGLTIVEAMAFSTPVVATDVGGIPEVLKENIGGFCVNSSDIDTFVEKILLLLRDKKLQTTIGAAGLKRYKKHFLAERMAKDYFNIIC